MKAINLKTEYLKDPLGIDIASPRLFWNCEGSVTQTSYQIIAEVDGSAAWDSGKVPSNQMTGIVCPVEVVSRRRVIWKVRLWDENDHAGEWSESAFFEWGLLKPADWQAKWITGNYRVDKKQRYPVDCFRRRISLSQSVKKARLYITACGLYAARLDGEKIFQNSRFAVTDTIRFIPSGPWLHKRNYSGSKRRYNMGAVKKILDCSCYISACILRLLCYTFILS